jgi:hypothetical protein
MTKQRYKKNHFQNTSRTEHKLKNTHETLCIFLLGRDAEWQHKRNTQATIRS